MKKWITFGEIYLTIQTNAFIHYLRKLPVVRYLISSEWYRRYNLKRVFTFFGVIIGLIKDAIGENIAVLVGIFIVPSIIAHDHVMDSFDYFFLFLSVKCVVSIAEGCSVFNSCSEDYTFLYHFMVDPKVYYTYKAMQQIFFSSIMLMTIPFRCAERHKTA